MTVLRLVAVATIFCASALAWAILGGSVMHRSGGSDASLRPEVASLWGGAHAQAAPSLHWEVERPVEETVKEERDGKTVSRVVTRQSVVAKPVGWASGRVRADLALKHRRKGLLWFDTYEVDFSAVYRAVVPATPVASGAEAPGEAVLRFAFPAPQGLYEGLSVTLNGRQAHDVVDLSQGVVLRSPAGPGEEITVEIAYRSRGLDTWRYLLGADGGIVEANDLEVVVTTDFEDLDFAEGSLSPSDKRRQGEGWRLGWEFDRLVTAQNLGIDLPNRLNPGPLAARITFFAPVALLFFFTVLVVVAAHRRVDLHPMHFFFLAAAFFAFHLLLAYLVDHLNVHLAFLVAAAASLALVATYLARVPGAAGVLRLAVAAQAIYLVFFSYTFFFEGFTGLTVTVGAVATLAVLMQVTARTDWAAALAKRPAATSAAG